MLPAILTKMSNILQKTKNNPRIHLVGMGNCCVMLPKSRYTISKSLDVLRIALTTLTFATIFTTPVIGETLTTQNSSTLLASSLPTGRRRPVRRPSRKPSLPTSTMTKTILERHNFYRSQVGVPPLTWSRKLEQDAQNWANYLASLGGNRLIHAQDLDGNGENLWMGSSGYFSHIQMVDSWGEEQKYYRNGIFPNVSSTGNWVDVGHYTQIIWRNTTEVGCAILQRSRFAIATAGGNDILVCRYAPAGNYTGERVF